MPERSNLLSPRFCRSAKPSRRNARLRPIIPAAKSCFKSLTSQRPQKESAKHAINAKIVGSFCRGRCYHPIPANGNWQLHLQLSLAPRLELHNHNLFTAIFAAFDHAPAEPEIKAFGG